MGKIKRIIPTSDCKCSRNGIYLELDYSLNINNLQDIINATNYKVNQKYLNKGILFLDGPNLIAMGPIGSSRFQIKCKNANCLAGLDELEKILGALS